MFLISSSFVKLPLALLAVCLTLNIISGSFIVGQMLQCENAYGFFQDLKLPMSNTPVKNLYYLNFLPFLLSGQEMIFFNCFLGLILSIIDLKRERIG